MEAGPRHWHQLHRSFHEIIVNHFFITLAIPLNFFFFNDIIRSRKISIQSSPLSQHASSYLAPGPTLPACRSANSPPHASSNRSSTSSNPSMPL